MSGLAKFSQSRLGAYSLVAALFLFVSGLALFLYGTRVETRRFRLEKLKVRAGRLLAANGRKPRTLKILHISDLHLQENDHKKVEFIRAITDDDYDMVVLTGDIFQFSKSFDFGPFLLARQPRLGAYAVFGNHDYYDYSLVNKTIGRVFRGMRQPDVRKDVSPHRRALEAGGFTVLVNECHVLPEENIFIAGLDYPGIKDSDLENLMKQSAGAEQLKLALFHLPWRLERLAEAGFDVVFGGHTHGGQIRLPGFGALITDSELHRSEASGLLSRGQTHFHISRGLGADPRSNLRLFCPPAATVIELTY
ncbi:MAG: metallophosphoesterase [Cyanobacteria bacterium SZAS LIN-3]|nr:metallophosphoesterase [Cyanobacteria bacterium SZAS LIN-3]